MCLPTWFTHGHLLTLLVGSRLGVWAIKVSFKSLRLGFGLALIILGTLSRYYFAHSITPWMLTVRYCNQS